MATVSHPVFPKGFPGKYQRALFVSLSRAHTLPTPGKPSPPAVHPEPALAFLAVGADAYETQKPAQPR